MNKAETTTENNNLANRVEQKIINWSNFDILMWILWDN